MNTAPIEKVPSSKRLCGFQRILKILFPVRCAYCGSLCKQESTEAVCQNCAIKLESLRLSSGMATVRIADGLPRATAAAMRYEGIAKKAVLGVKYYHRLYAVPQLARQTLAAARAAELPQPDLLLPVPRYRTQKTRVSVSVLLARQLSALTGVPLTQRLLIKEYSTRPQHSLSGHARQGNLVGAFTVTDPAALAGKTVWIVDDILTTGATLRECSRMVWLYGAKEVYGVCFADTPAKVKKKTEKPYVKTYG